MTAINRADVHGMDNRAPRRGRATPRPARAAALHANRLNSPTKSKSPQISKSIARNKLNILASCQPPRRSVPEDMSAVPAVARSNSSPKPGRPSGKTGKVDRSEKLVNSDRLYRLLFQRIPKPRNESVPLLGYPRTFEELSLEVNDAAANADRNRLGSIVGAQFFHDVFDVHFDRLFSNKELFRDVAVSVPARDLTKNLYFAFGQRFIAHVLGNVSRNFGRDALLARMHLADYFQ